MFDTNGLSFQTGFRIPSIPSFSMRRGWQQLIIIGNGFDLECGLKTRYSDFFNPRRAKVYPPSKTDLEAQGKTWREYALENKTLSGM